MGDCNAVELGQRAHVELGLRCRAFSPFELLVSQGRAPRGKMSAGIVIDDVLFAEQLLKEAGPLNSEGVRRLKLPCEEYLQEGLTAHPKKTFQGQSKASFWGVSVDGESGLIRPNPARLVPVLDLTARIAQLGLASVGLLEVVAGSWVAILQTRRRMLCLIEELYLAQRGRQRDDIIELSSSLVQELWLLVILGPICTTDARAQSIPEVFLSDASMEKMATVRAPLPLVLAREFQRHCLARGTWSRLLSPWRCWQKQHEQLFEEDELPDGVPLVSHPLWLLLAQTLQFRLNHCSRASGRKHINLLEMESVLELERRLSLRRCDLRYLLGSDSQVCLAALVKGRSSSPRLNLMLRSSLAVVLGSGIYGNYGYVPSLANVADDPTRDEVVRSPCRDLPEWWAAACEGDFESFDRWLASLGFDPMQVAKLPWLVVEKPKSDAVTDELLAPLRAVQKTAKLAVFERVQKSDKDRQFSVSSVSHLGSESKESKSQEAKPKLKRRSLREKTNPGLFLLFV